MKIRGILAAVALVVALLILFKWMPLGLTNSKPQEVPAAEPVLTTIHDKVEKGETLSKIFSKHGLTQGDVILIRNASMPVHSLRSLHIGRSYRIDCYEDGQLHSFIYWIDDDTKLAIQRHQGGFFARKEPICYAKRVLVLEGAIEENLVNSMRQDNEHLNLALALSDIYVWDIDFTTELQKGDSYRLVVEGLYLDGTFKKFGKILAAEFINKGKAFRAYLRETDGRKIYYDEQGTALRRMFLRAPLNFRRISSHYSMNRRHPILKIRRPHLGLDYAAAKGTPVSAVGDGVVEFAGWRGQYGKLVVIRHPNRWRTYYGHLSGIAKSVRKGHRIDQGQLIGYVGATGLATGPHLHYEVRHRGKNLDPLKVNTPRVKAIRKSDIQAFYRFRDMMDLKLASDQVVSATTSLTAIDNASG